MPDLLRLRVYLDTNVLFSASLRERSRFLDFWRLHEIRPVVSHYAIGEISKHLAHPEHAKRFARLLERTEIVSDADARLIPPHIRLVAKDAPILAAAIGASVDYLATGDKNHFSHLYGKTVSGVRIMSPTDFLSLYDDRLIK